MAKWILVTLFYLIIYAAAFGIFWLLIATLIEIGLIGSGAILFLSYVIFKSK